MRWWVAAATRFGVNLALGVVYTVLGRLGL